MHVSISRIFLEVKTNAWELSGVPFHEASATSASEEQLKTIPWSRQ